MRLERRDYIGRVGTIKHEHGGTSGSFVCHTKNNNLQKKVSTHTKKNYNLQIERKKRVKKKGVEKKE